jgi:hypothetical protein
MPPVRPYDAEPEDDFGVEDEWEPSADTDDEDDIDDPAFGDDDDESDTTPCPACGSPVYEHADYCPSCGAAIVPDGGRPSSRAWLVAGVLIVAVLAGAYLWL